MIQGTNSEKVSDDSLKMMASVVALVISAVGVNFAAAEFINNARDTFPQCAGAFGFKASALYDWSWGYLVAIVANFLFFKIVAIVIRLYITPKSVPALVALGKLVYWSLCLNFWAWVIGAAKDFVMMIWFAEPPCPSST